MSPHLIQFDPEVEMEPHHQDENPEESSDDDSPLETPDNPPCFPRSPGRIVFSLSVWGAVSASGEELLTHAALPPPPLHDERVQIFPLSEFLLLRGPVTAGDRRRRLYVQHPHGRSTKSIPGSAVPELMRGEPWLVPGAGPLPPRTVQRLVEASSVPASVGLITNPGTIFSYKHHAYYNYSNGLSDPLVPDQI